MIYFDSDASDVELSGSGLTNKQVNELRKQYVVDLKYVIETILNTGIIIIIIIIIKSYNNIIYIITQ